MKIRNGFVSNSSSSSFIVAFQKKPESTEETLKMLGLDEHVSCFGNAIHGFEAANRVYEDILDEESNLTDEEAIELLSNEVYWEASEKYEKEHGKLSWDESNPDNRQERWDTIDKICKEKAKVMWENFKKQNKNSLFYQFCYSDNDGTLYTVMEHGEIFSELPYIRISQH